MLPFVSETNHSAGVADGQNVVAVPPSSRFRPLSGEPITEISIKPQVYERTHGNTVARENGLRYEDKIQRRFTELLHGYQAGPHVHFRDGKEWRAVIPDGILVRSAAVVVFEIKTQHCADAWWQLHELYGPVLAKLFHRPISLLEVVRSYDPGAPFPAKHALVPSLETWLTKPQADFGVLICRL